MTDAIAIRQQHALGLDIDIFKLGEVFSSSGYFADAKDATQAIVKILAGRELGIGPMASMNSIHIVQGKPTLSANLIASSTKNANSRYNYKVLDLSEISCEIEFFEQGAPIGKSKFTMAEAKNAGLTNKDVWRKHPKNMLFARAISNGARWYCPDVFNGATVYTPEELNANVTEDGEMILHPRTQAEFSKDLVESTIAEATGGAKTITIKAVPPIQEYTGTEAMIENPATRTDELAAQRGDDSNKLISEIQSMLGWMNKDEAAFNRWAQNEYSFDQEWTAFGVAILRELKIKVEGWMSAAKAAKTAA